MNPLVIIFWIIVMGIVIYSILLLVSSYYSRVDKGDKIEFELNGVHDSGVVEYIKDDFIYVISELNPDHYTVIIYKDIL